MNPAMPGRHVLITGASRGIGEALAAHCLAAGDRVIGCGRSPSAIAHERYRHVVVDVTDAEAVEGLLREVKQSLKTLDVLINNAGIAGMNAIALTPLSAARRMVETNFLAPFNLTREALRLMRRSAAARIVNISTVAVPLRLEGEAVYAASKSALETFTRIAARELAPFGITCNAVGPCPIKTRLTAGVPDAKIQALIDRQAIRRWGVPEDVVNVVDFFLRPESGMVTGQVVYLGGAG
jgi:3-oxoacyl-[acyl-carrier protein] reductase